MSTQADPPPRDARRSLPGKGRGLQIAAAGTLVLALAGVGAGMLPHSSGSAPQASSAPFPHPSKVAVLALENKSYGQVIGNPRAPYLNRLARQNALATRYYALGHPSLRNYVALTSGTTGEIKQNCTRCDTPGPNLVGQLDQAGITWKGYFHGLTSSKGPGARTSTYNPHYNPFVYSDTVRTSSAASANVVGFSALHRDLARGSLPRFSWIAPSVKNDGHNGSLQRSDRYASRLVPRVLRALGPRGVLYLTWDEGARKDTRGVHGTSGGGRIALIAAGGAARKGTTTATPANHYALLRTIEANFGLATLGQAGSSSTPVLSGLLKQGPSPSTVASTATRPAG